MNHGEHLKGKECGPRKLQKETEAVPKRDISVQAGKVLRLKRTEDFKSFHFLLIFFFSLQGKTTLHHYLFDPTADAVFQPPLGSRVWTNQLTESAEGGAILNLMRKQLDLTEHSLR